MSDLYQDRELARVISQYAPLRYSVHSSSRPVACDICATEVINWVVVRPRDDAKKSAKICVANSCGTLLQLIDSDPHPMLTPLFEDGSDWAEIVLKACAPKEASWETIDPRFAVSSERADALERAMVIAKYRESLKIWGKAYPTDGELVHFRGRDPLMVLTFGVDRLTAADIDYMKHFNRYCRDLTGSRHMETL